MELLEREQCFDELEAILSEVAAGNGRFVLLSGEAGIGKTSVVERFAEAHQQQARVLWGACDALYAAPTRPALRHCPSNSKSDRAA